jgi:dTDP-4-amino-4,6-dideoxygalactose transaminase
MSIVIPESRLIPRIPFATTLISPEAQQAAARVLASGWVTTGPEVGEFEREFAEAVGAEHAVAVSSCTAAIELALRSMRLPRDAKVLTSTMTFCGAVHAIVHAGLQPVLVDVNPETVMPDPETVAQAVGRTGGVDAMVVLHFAGQPAEVQEMAAAAGLPLERVIEDAAHALGTVVGDRRVGAISSATCFSFYATKNLPIGEGGMVTTLDPEIADFVRTARSHGMSRDAWRRYLPGSGWRYAVDVAGLKANMTDVQAAVGRAQLRHLPDWQSRRAEIADRYDRGLSGIPGIGTPARPSSGRHAWHLYVMRVLPTSEIDRDAFITALAERGVDCSVHFIPIHHQPYFLELLGRDIAAEFHSADATFRQIVSLPLHPALTDEEVDRVCERVAEVAFEAGRLRSAALAPAEPIASSNGEIHPAGDDRRVARCLIVGAGLPGRAIATELKPVAEFGLRPIGFLEENGSRRRRIAGLPVLGRMSDVSKVVEEREIDVVVIALPTLSSSKIRRVAQEAAAAGAFVRYLPASKEPGSRDPRIRDLRRHRAVPVPDSYGNGQVAAAAR